MKLAHRLLAAAALTTAPLLATGASAQTYDITFGSSLVARITTTPSTGTNRLVTGISGTFMGQTITGLIANPYAPANAFYYNTVGVPQPTNTFPGVLLGTQYYYEYNDLLINGSGFDDGGLLFRTATTTANLFNSGGYSIAYGSSSNNGAGTLISGSFSIAPAAVPEPASWAMLILGVGAIGVVLRRKVRASEVMFDAKIKRIAASQAA